MLKISFAAFFLLISSAHADEWSTSDTGREAVYLVLLGIDWAQTRHIVSNPDKFYEFNPIIGRHPHTDRVDIYFAGSVLLNIVIADALPSKYREVFQYVNIGWQGAFVLHNFSIGISARF